MREMVWRPNHAKIRRLHCLAWKVALQLRWNNRSYPRVEGVLRELVKVPPGSDRSGQIDIALHGRLGQAERARNGWSLEELVESLS